MPAGAPGAVGARPLGVLGLALLGRLPEHEVERILLAVEHGDALAGAQLVERLARELAVAGKAPHREVHVAAGGAVGEAVFLQPADHGEHGVDVLGGARLEGRRADADGGHVLVHRRGHLGGEPADRHAALDRAADDLVVDVGDVAHVGDAKAARLQPAGDDVEGHQEARVADVAVVVDRHAADVHPHVAGLDRTEFLDRPGQGVVDAQAHGGTGGSRRRSGAQDGQGAGGKPGNAPPEGETERGGRLADTSARAVPAGRIPRPAPRRARRTACGGGPRRIDSV